MKKRSMLAIASLATGLVVAAVSPSHGAAQEPGGLGIDKALGSLTGTIAADENPDRNDADAPAAQEN